MTKQEFIRQISKKEIENHLYDVRITDISIYSYIRRYMRDSSSLKHGFKVMQQVRVKDTNRVNYIKTFLLSLFGLVKILILGKHYDTVFISFSRIDKVGDTYLDKFTDPIRELCLKDRSISFMHSNNGHTFKTRHINKNIVYIDALDVFSRFYAQLFYRSFYKKYQSEFKKLYSGLTKTFGTDWNKKVVTLKIIHLYKYTLYNEYLLKKVKAKRVFGPNRDLIKYEVIPAHRLGIQSYELQHGITYGETLLYSGYRDPMVLPDYFLAFGENDPKDVYGINEDRIVNIGFAFNDYIAQQKDFVQYKTQDVLVISDPEITDTMIDIVHYLAKDNPNSDFYMRPHPQETISEDQRKRLLKLPNAHWQDNRINISMTMQGFTHIVGESSTVLYEALSMGKKVGKLFLQGLQPRYLKEADKDCFWQISNQEDFQRFLIDSISSKTSKKIYSKFDKDKLLKLINA